MSLQKCKHGVAVNHSIACGNCEREYFGAFNTEAAAGTPPPACKHHHTFSDDGWNTTKCGQCMETIGDQIGSAVMGGAYYAPQPTPSPLSAREFFHSKWNGFAPRDLEEALDFAEAYHRAASAPQQQHIGELNEVIGYLEAAAPTTRGTQAEINQCKLETVREWSELALNPQDSVNQPELCPCYMGCGICINCRAASVPAPGLTEEDRRDIEFAARLLVVHRKTQQAGKLMALLSRLAPKEGR